MSTENEILRRIAKTQSDLAGHLKPVQRGSVLVELIRNLDMKFLAEENWLMPDAAASSLHAVLDSVTIYLLHLSGAPVALRCCEIRFLFPNLFSRLSCICLCQSSGA